MYTGLGDRVDMLNEELMRTKELMGVLTEQVKEGDSNYTIPYNEDYIQEWVDRWNAFIYDRLDGGYGGPNDIQSEIDYDLRTLCPEVIKVLQASYDILGWNVARSKSWVDNNIQTQIVPKIEQWKNNGGDMTTLERPEINLEKDCPEFYKKRELKESDSMGVLSEQVPETIENVEDSTTSEIIEELKEVLETWETTKYISDFDRWNQYHKDIRNLVEKYDAYEKMSVEEPLQERKKY